jgi:adenylyltransferase/sulfurtransferase
MPEIGLEGQTKLRKAKVIVVGAGGLGSPLLLYLSALGIGSLTVVDNDIVSLSNLNRQVLYTVNDIGQSKSAVAVQRIQALNPEVQAAAIQTHIEKMENGQVIADYDVVVDASDNLETKALLNQLCVYNKIPLVWAAVSRFEGQMGTYVPGYGCRACIFPQNPEPGSYPTPAELGVIGAAAGVIGTLQALEVVKVLLDIGEPLLNKILLFDGLHNDFDLISYTKHPTCPICS